MFSSKTLFSKFVLATTGLLILLSFSNDGYAQKKRRGFDVKGYITGLDKNSNGLLEPSEMKGRTSGFLKNLGFDTAKPIRIKDIVRKVEKDKKNVSSSSRKSKTEAKVPGFGVDTEAKGVADFSASTGGSRSGAVSLESKYGKKIMEQVADVLRRYDRNKNSQLDPEEIKRGRWGSPKPNESDLNRDGILTRSELANRYLAREKNVRSSRDSNRRSSGDREREKEKKRIEKENEREKRKRDEERSRAKKAYRAKRMSSNKTESKSSSSNNSKYMKYAKGLVAKYDTDKDNRLSKKEQEKMTAPPKSSADTNKDGYISVEELAFSIGGGAPPSSKTSKDSKFSKRKDNRFGSKSKSSKRASSFSSGDRNNDGQILMHEFTEEWDSEGLEEFDRRDLNKDGVITEKEWAKSRAGG